MFSASKTGAVSGGFQIANSLRFRSSASAYLNRTPSTSGTGAAKLWTYSVWFKRGSLGSTQSLLWANPSVSSSDTNNMGFAFQSGDTLSVQGQTINFLVTSQVFRDPSAWYHAVLVCDTAQATAADRLKLYINGAQVTAFSTANYPSQNATVGIGLANPTFIGRQAPSGSQYFDGYMAEINFIDGQALTPSSFGEIDATTGVWKPKQYSGSYGTNGFKLNFSNGTSTTTLGYDSSGNSNNWTTNNISLTAGSTYDWMIDSPTKYPGSSYGVGNYCVLNPLDKGTTYIPSLTNANLQYTAPNGTQNPARGTLAVTSGKWYFEAICTNKGYNAGVGVMTALSNLGTGDNFKNFWGTQAAAWYSSNSFGNSIVSNGSSSSYATAFVTNDVLMIAFDIATGKIWFGKNGTWNASGDPAGGTNNAATFTATDPISPFLDGTYSGTADAFATNFGQRPFAYTTPSGFKSLCTQNLPNVSIYNGAQYMAATTYTGTGSSRSVANTVNGVGFQPDFVWIKSRSAAQNNGLQDSVRGATLQLSSNLTTAEITSSGEVTAFNSNGFSLGADVSGYGTNTNAATYVAWQWKAGGTAVTNTAGSITSQVSANTTAGFSVVTYTGTGSAGTIGHGLGVAPSMVICKARSLAGENWPVYHVGITNPATNQLRLNATTASEFATNWNSTNPTSSVFSVGSGNAINSNTNTYVAYCFAAIAGYSAFGRYTGNGSTDGPFVYCGFRPRWIMVKASSISGEHWEILDSSRLGYNAMNALLFADLSNAEDTSVSRCDILSNGFKVRTGNLGVNGSGSTYIYAAFAENPFQNALAR